ncbi:MAG: APC family permease [Chloroflexi bacterium]|nr:APC family permease [Chloroflexota bacterium]
MSGLKRTLTLWDLTALGINGVIGAGIFLLPGFAFQKAGSASIISYLVCAFFCLAVALCYAELSARFHGTGASYHYAMEVMGRPWGFAVGWMMWVASVVGWASMGKGITGYVEYLIPGLPAWVSPLLIVLLFVILGAVNYTGVKSGAWASNILVVFKIIPLLAFVIIGMFFLKPEKMAGMIPADFDSFKNLGGAVFIVLFAFLGFEAVPIPSEESRDPRRDAPRAILLVLLIVSVLYFLIQMVFVSNVPAEFEPLKSLAEAAGAFMGSPGGYLMAAGALLSILGACSSLAVTVPRILFALSRDGFLPKPLSRIHPVCKTPSVSIIISTGLAMVLALTGSFEKLMIFTILATLWQYIPSCIAVIKLKWQKSEMSYLKGWWGWAVLALGAAFLILMLTRAEPVQIIASIGAIAFGVLLFFALRKYSGGEDTPA